MLSASLSWLTCLSPLLERGDILVEIKRASINPIDWKLFTAGYQGLFPIAKFPYIPGFDVCGTVKEVGAGVTEFAVGDLIAVDIGLIESCSDPAPASGTAGAFAEFTCVPANLAVKVSTGVDMDSAAGLPLAGLTAYQAIFSGSLPSKSVTGEPLGNLTSGQTILVIGGASSTGSYAIQLAKAVGATVLTTASTTPDPVVRRRSILSRPWEQMRYATIRLRTGLISLRVVMSTLSSIP